MSYCFSVNIDKCVQYWNGDVMRAYIVKIIGAVIMYSAGETLLPEGNIKKYACIVLSLLVCLAFISPLDISEDFRNEIFTVTQSEIEDTYESGVREEYERRIENMIYENTGGRAEVKTGDNYEIVSVIVSNDAAALYVINSLGVERSVVQIGKN